MEVNLPFTMHFEEPRRLDVGRLALIALAITAAWIVVGLFFGTQHTLMIEARGYPDNLTERLLAMSISMLVWACFTPVVIYVGELFPLRKTQRLRSIAVLVPVAFCFAGLRASLDGTLPILLEGMPMTFTDYRNSVLAMFHTHLLFVILLLIIANSMRLLRDEAARERAEARFRAELAEARLWRLRANLHPHFLFNALNSVAGVAHTDAEAAREMLQQLSELLQRSLASMELHDVPLGEELDLLSRYLGVLKVRFGERLTTSIEVGDDTLRRATVPPLLVQPLVENAIVHGVSARREGARLTLRVERDGPWLQLQVRDNGPGCAPEAVYRRDGIGVSNVRARLESIYGKQQSLRFGQRDGEFVAEVRIPFREAFT